MARRLKQLQIQDPHRFINNVCCLLLNNACLPLKQTEIRSQSSLQVSLRFRFVSARLMSKSVKFCIVLLVVVSTACEIACSRRSILQLSTCAHQPLHLRSCCCFACVINMPEMLLNVLAFAKSASEFRKMLSKSTHKFLYRAGSAALDPTSLAALDGKEEHDAFFNDESLPGLLQIALQTLTQRHHFAPSSPAN